MDSIKQGHRACWALWSKASYAQYIPKNKTLGISSAETVVYTVKNRTLLEKAIRFLKTNHRNTQEPREDPPLTANTVRCLGLLALPQREKTELLKAVKRLPNSNKDQQEYLGIVQLARKTGREYQALPLCAPANPYWQVTPTQWQLENRQWDMAYQQHGWTKRDLCWDLRTNCGIEVWHEPKPDFLPGDSAPYSVFSRQ
ncbi:uncharacterized protein BCR38DRAFT_407556 [Pseudomassariella vexata]|uniref:Uncharacterized protein n=1 Tax=Pseudomassariella vexata TaxID=1141098 RepID=A0A1Y2E9Q5_9PEZI|nr:uncharacterized protein BCR38DRAFT_407556 [Pseudomassariella vexata]ORY67595.1 hypothetical protein BCR38DRAFT_407556 [Pseudomassariella vexata]